MNDISRLRKNLTANEALLKERQDIELKRTLCDKVKIANIQTQNDLWNIVSENLTIGFKIEQLQQYCQIEKSSIDKQSQLLKCHYGVQKEKYSTVKQLKYQINKIKKQIRKLQIHSHLESKLQTINGKENNNNDNDNNSNNNNSNDSNNTNKNNSNNINTIDNNKKQNDKSDKTFEHGSTSNKNSIVNCNSRKSDIAQSLLNIEHTKNEHLHDTTSEVNSKMSSLAKHESEHKKHARTNISTLDDSSTSCFSSVAKRGGSCGNGGSGNGDDNGGIGYEDDHRHPPSPTRLEFENNDNGINGINIDGINVNINVNQLNRQQLISNVNNLLIENRQFHSQIDQLRNQIDVLIEQRKNLVV